MRLLNPIFGQKPDMGALPALYAATAPDVRGADYFGPGGRAELKGYPVRVQSSTAAARLWTRSEEQTGVRYRFPSPGSLK